MKSDQDLYRQLRALPCDKLWLEEVPRFDEAPPRERMQRVAVIRAVGVVFAESGTAEQKTAAREWLRRLLQDPAEKIRRYAMAALPKLGAGASEEGELLSLLKTTTGDREKKSLGSALQKIGGAATLAAVTQTPGLLPQTEQKVKASLARAESPSAIRLDRVFTQFRGLRIHLRCRKGLETIVRDEVKEYIRRHGKFRLLEFRGECVAITPVAPFSLADIFTLRCFDTVGFGLGVVRAPTPAESIEPLAKVITSPLSRKLLQTFTEGSLRYRLDYVGKGHQRAAVQLVANRAYALCPDILNDAQQAPWAIDIHPIKRGASIELRPKLVPDPRLAFRTDDVWAASHPPLAACMARLAGPLRDEIIWDPFCGSGLELIECSLRSSEQYFATLSPPRVGTPLRGVRGRLGEPSLPSSEDFKTEPDAANERTIKSLHGTDLDPAALAIAQANISAAKISIPTQFTPADFRDYAKIPGLGRQSVTLIITNPPMGRRIRVPSLTGLIRDIFTVAADALNPGGRLIFVNPLRVESEDPTLQLLSRQVVDLGGFECRLEVYLKQAT